MSHTIPALAAVVDGTPADPARPCPEYPVYSGDDLGAIPDAQGTSFRVWAPTASGITVRLFATGDPDADDIIETHELAAGPDGTWSARVDGIGHGAYYDYLVCFPDGAEHRTADPWARAAGVNGRRSMVVDLRRTNPDGWAEDRRPHIPSRELVIWETHIGDFSNDPHSGVPAEHRGTYLAFTHPDTSVDDAGAFPTCVAYLKRLGITAVQLLPFYDYGSIDESVPHDAPDRAFNWGYDPVNYNVPEGSYSTDPRDGEVRIRECKRMIQALHEAGIAVIMDVVYNHMFSTDNWFERMIPGYALRRRVDGGFSNGSGCGNDVATGHPMMRKYIVDSVTYWAREYHIDGFRFDLMGLIDVDTMNAIRTSLDRLPGGATILMHGEPWAASTTALVPGAGTVLADKRGMPYLSPRIGAFCDSTRDAVRGHIFYQKVPGYLAGAAADYADDIRHAEDAWRGTLREVASVGQVIQYVSAHDDLTLWDKLCATMRRLPTDVDYAAESESCADLMRANLLASGIVFTAAGVPFLLSGEEFARTKHGVSDSFSSPAELNQLDWRRAQRLEGLVDHYAALIQLRRGNPAYFGGARMIVPRTDEVVVFRVGGDCVAVNPTGRVQEQPTVDLEIPGPYDEVSKIEPEAWQCIYCSASAASVGDDEAFVGEDESSGRANESDAVGGHDDTEAWPRVERRRLQLPPWTFTVWRHQRV